MGRAQGNSPNCCSTALHGPKILDRGPIGENELRGSSIPPEKEMPIEGPETILFWPDRRYAAKLRLKIAMQARTFMPSLLPPTSDSESDRIRLLPCWHFDRYHSRFSSRQRAPYRIVQAEKRAECHKVHRFIIRNHNLVISSVRVLRYDLCRVKHQSIAPYA
jgi:hypothetical protein